MINLSKSVENLVHKVQLCNPDPPLLIKGIATLNKWLAAQSITLIIESLIDGIQFFL